MKNSQYVLTPDYAMKMLNINECMECKSPVVICGETGVGKTFLVKMISEMWKLSIVKALKNKRNQLLIKLKSSSKYTVMVHILVGLSC